MNDNEINEQMLPRAFEMQCISHYAKALRKHRFFADILFDWESMSDCARRDLELKRKEIIEQDYCCELHATTLLDCEVLEANVAHLDGQKEKCIDELYDAIAVIMRMIAVVEGKQTLGEKEAAK